MISFIKLVFKRIFRCNNRNCTNLANFIFQNIFGINRFFPLSVHYTTQIANPQKIEIEGGEKTINSFAYSGNWVLSHFKWVDSVYY